MTLRATLTSILALLGLGLCSCKDGSDKIIPFPTADGGSFTQVERLARPAVNEGLITDNVNLNLWNAVPPTADTSPAAAGIAADATATLTALGNNATRTNDIVTAFLPDVMRINTNQSIAVGTGAYATGAQPIGAGTVVRPVSGRKIEDDVIDITLSVLTDGAFTADNVGFVGVAGNEAQPGHSLLSGQGAPLGAATFPFLSDPE